MTRDAGNKVGQGGRQEQKGTYYLRSANISQKWRASEALFEKYHGLCLSQSYKCLSFPIKYCLLLAYMISVVSYQQVENKSLQLKRALLLPLLPQLKRQEWRLLPPAPLSGMPGNGCIIYISIYVLSVLTAFLSIAVYFCQFSSMF